MPTSSSPSIASLKRAIEIAEQIESLQSRLASLLGGSAAPATAPKAAAAPKRGRRKGRRTMSAGAREKIAAAQRARWAKSKGAGKVRAVKAAPGKPGRKKRTGLTAAGRARLAAAMKARWAARKKGAPAPNAARK